MANQVVWKCQPCGRTCGKTAEFCAQCGQHWSKVAEGYTGQGWRHSWRSEASDGQYPQSPRRRSPRKRPPKGPGQKGGKQQGQPQPVKGGKGGKSEPSRPSLDSLPAPPPAPVVVGPKTATTPAPTSGVPSAERAQLEALTGCLFAAKDALPAEVRETLERLQLVETQSTAKDLHKAVAAQSQAKKQLLHVQASRASYLEAWHTYVDKVSSLLQTQLNEQIEQLTAFDETELQWTTALEKASMDLARLARSSSNPAEQVEMECDEEEDHLADTDIRTERELSQRREKQLHASRQLVASIESVRLNAQEQLQQHGREGSRTPRRRKADVDLTKEENLEESNRQSGPADSGQDGGGSKDGKNGDNAEDFVDEWCASFSGAALAHEVSLFELDLEVEHTFWTDPRHAAGQYDFEEAAWDTLPTQSCDYEALEVFFTESYADAHCKRDGQTVLSGTALTSRTFRVPTLHMAKQVVELDEVRGISRAALESANQRARALSSALTFFPSVEVRERYKVGSVSNLGANCNVHNDASTELPCTSSPNPLRRCKVGSLSNLGAICSLPPVQSELHIKSLDDKHASPYRVVSWPQQPPGRYKVGSVSNLGAASSRINDAVLWTHSSMASMCANARLPCDTPQDLSQRYKVGSLSNLGAYSPPVAAPASPALSVPTARSMPKASAITDLHMIIAAQVQIGPEWLAGPFLNTDARSLTRMQLEPAAADRDTRYTILEYRSDTIVRRSMPAWTPLEYVAHAIRQVPYRVQRAYFLEVPLPGYPCPQILLTPAGLPLGHRTLPIDLRPLQGLLHVVRVPCGLETPALWDTLQDKGVEDLDALATATRDGRLTLTDQNGRIVQHTRPLPEQQWLITPGIEEDLPPTFVLRYVGGGPLTFRLPRPPQPIEPPRHATAAEIEALRAAEHPGPAWPDTTSTTTAMCAAQKTVERPASKPPGMPEPDIEPPSLLQRVAAQADGKLGQTSRPQEVPSILPGYLERDCLQQESVDVYSWGATAGAPNHAYTIFDVVRHATTRPRPREGTLTAIIRAAVLEAPFPVGAVQVLMKGVQGLPQPQLVLHQRTPLIDFDQCCPRQLLRVFVLLPYTWPLHVGTFHPPEGGCLVLGIHHGLAQLDDCPPAMLETYHTRAVSISERQRMLHNRKDLLTTMVDCPCIEGAFRCSDAEPSDTGALWAHNLCESGPGAEATSKPGPTILSLDQLIAQHAERREAGGLLTGVSADMFPFLFEQYSLALFSPEWQHIPDVPSTTRQFLDGLRTLPSGAKPAAIQFFVDGSFFPAEHGPIKCGWAICALAYYQQEWQWVGWLAAGTDPDGDHSSLCEPVKSSYETELSALCFALTCAVSMQVPCLFGFDSTSAAATAAADAVDKNGSALASACASLVHLLQLQGCAPLWHHIRSHQGHPLNEFVDATAKFAAKTMTSCHIPTSLSEAQHDGTLPWIWLATGLHPSVPRVDQSGILRDAAQLQGDAHTLHSVLPSPAAMKGQVSFDFQAVTYNCLTLKSQAQQESLAEQFNKHHSSVIGLQETRTTLTERKANRHFHVIGGPAQNGHLGCQLWLARSRPVAFCGKTPITWDPTTFCVILATPRLLLVTAKAADQTFAFLVGHSPTAKAGQAACELFWQHMHSALRRIPTNSIPLVLVDANAKNFGARGDLDEIAEPHHNHEGFANLVASHALTTSGHVAHDGQEFVSWTGPDGQTACIDYVLCPTQLAQGMCILGPLPGFVGYLDHDHKPIATQIRWQTSGSVRSPNARLNGDSLHTAAGRQALRQAYQNMPPVPWEVSVDEHLRRINQHVIDNLQQVCVRSGNKPRDRTTSDHTWALIRDRRHLRREVHRTRDTSLAPEYHTMLGEQIKDLGRLIRAAAIRKAFDSARESGIDTLHRLCRSITKSGRRYRAPSLCPALRAKSGQVEDDSYKVLGDHFAEAELGQHCAPTEIATREPLYEPQDFLLPNAFSVASLSRAFASLTAKRASGGSQIPVEAYKFAPLAAAHCHAPLLLKCLLRRQCPILWRGGIATAIPKPLKPADSVEGWRSILLLEAGAKGIAKAIRNDLLQGYSQLRQAGQSGSMPGQPLQVSMAHVRGLVKRIKASGQSGGILFVDGRAAFYSVLREALLGTDSAQPQQFVEKLAELVFHTREKQSAFILAALGPGLLQQTGVPLAVRRYVAAGLDRTWFSVGQSPRHVYETRCGSVPGAPLADLYFQIIFSQVLANIYAGLDENGLIANCPGTSASSQLSLPIPTWMDDIAVPVLAPKPCQLLDRAAQAVRVVDTAMHAAGIRLNFSRGKTEFLAVIGGEGSRQLRQEWLCANGATFTVPLETAPITVHLTGSYIHLGSEIAFSGKDGPDIFRRRSLARRLTTDLSKLMHNSCLSTEERLNMLIAMPLARFRHGAGLWSLEFTQDQHAYQSAYIEPFRKYFRALTGITSQGLDDHQLCLCLGILTAAQMREVDLTRHVGWLAADGSSVLRELWLTSGPWFQEAQRAVKACSAHLGIRPTTAWEALLAKPCLAKQWARSYARRCRKIQRQLQPAALRRWQTYHDAQQQGAFFLHVRERARTVGLSCPECQCHFGNPAALGSHRRKVHGVAARATQVTFGTRCEVCSTEYWSTRRLREHLRRSSTCLKVWEAADREVEAPANDAGHEWLPSAKACGPRPWWATLQPEDPPEPSPQAALPSAAIFAKWLGGESSKISASQLLDLVEKGIRFRLTDDDLPLASLHMPAATYSLVQHAMWAAQTILAQSAGSQEDSFWRVSVQGMRVIFWPNGVRTAATNWSELPTEWAFD
ncbi:unnamed protein product [Symbiodinium sp. CCMP2592]|nr:unnamed protein product [Symbiodinium sp. CCMP2592]